MFRWLRQLFCKHEFKPIQGLMGFFCKIQCSKCHKIDDDFSNAVYSHFSLEIEIKEPKR